MSDKYRKCIKCGASAFQDPTLNFHYFPRAGKKFNHARLHIWAEYCFDNVTEEVLKSLHKRHKLLCSKHFDRSAYTDDTMKKLNSNAVPNVPGSPTKTLQQYPILVNLSVPPQPTTQNMPILVLPDPSQEPVVLENNSMSKSMQPHNKLASKHFKKCKIYLNKIYRLKKALKKKKNAKQSRKCFFETLSESEYFEKLNQHLKPAFGVLLQSQMINLPRKLNGRRWTLHEKIQFL